jgi:hypothetical protein
MSSENLVNIDIESDGPDDNRNNRYLKNSIEEVQFNCMDGQANENQPLLGGIDHADAGQVIYNQFPSE